MSEKTTELQKYLKRFKNAQRRALYWSGNPSYSPYRAKARHSGKMDEKYELAMCDQDSLAGRIEELGGKVKIRDYKKEFRAKFSALMAKRTATPSLTSPAAP